MGQRVDWTRGCRSGGAISYLVGEWARSCGKCRFIIRSRQKNVCSETEKSLGFHDFYTCFLYCKNLITKQNTQTDKAEICYKIHILFCFYLQTKYMKPVSIIGK